MLALVDVDHIVFVQLHLIIFLVFLCVLEIFFSFKFKLILNLKVWVEYFLLKIRKQIFKLGELVRLGVEELFENINQGLKLLTRRSDVRISKLVVRLLDI